jgi:hypothetical protein
MNIQVIHDLINLLINISYNILPLICEMLPFIPRIFFVVKRNLEIFLKFIK